MAPDHPGPRPAGHHQNSLHRGQGEVGVDLVLAVGGDLAKQLAIAAGAAGVPEMGIVRDNKTAAAHLECILRPDDVVLVKASRGGQLW